MLKRQKISDIDIKPLNSKAFDLQNVLLDFCNVNVDKIKPPYDQQVNTYSHQRKIEKFFGKIRKLPNNSNLLKNFGDKFLDLNEEEDEEDDQK